MFLCWFGVCGFSVRPHKEDLRALLYSFINWISKKWTNSCGFHQPLFSTSTNDFAMLVIQLTATKHKAKWSDHLFLWVSGCASCCLSISSAPADCKSMTTLWHPRFPADYYLFPQHPRTAGSDDSQMETLNVHEHVREHANVLSSNQAWEIQAVTKQ